VGEKRHTEDRVKALWRDVANWQWDPKTHGIGQPLVVPVPQEPNPGQPLGAPDQLEFRFVPAGTAGFARNSIVCEEVVVAGETNFAWITRPYEFFTTGRREDGSHDVYRVDRSLTGDAIYCTRHTPATANNEEMRTVTGLWPIQQFLDREDVPSLAKSIIRDLCVPRRTKTNPEPSAGPG
jgi:hypothetical protein